MWKPGQIVTLRIQNYLFRCRVVKRKRTIENSYMRMLLEHRKTSPYLRKLPDDCLLQLINKTK